ncbi:type II secretion system F family protein [Peptostreptococcaceae bacterium AGR-M142]
MKKYLIVYYFKSKLKFIPIELQTKKEIFNNKYFFDKKILFIIRDYFYDEKQIKEDKFIDILEDINFFLKKGIPFNKILNILEDENIKILKKYLEKGLLLSDFAKEKTKLNNYYLNILKLNEFVDSKEEIIDYLIKFYKKMKKHKKKLNSKLFYPKILISTSILVFLFIFGFLIPNIKLLIDGFYIEINIFLKIIFKVSEIINTNIILFILLAFIFTFMIFNDKKIFFLDNIFFCKLNKLIYNYKIIKLISFLKKANLNSLQIIEFLAKNTKDKRLILMKEELYKGNDLSSLLKKYKILDKKYINYFKISFETGDKNKVFKILENEYEENLDYILENIEEKILPTSIIIISLFITLIILSVLIPVYTMISNFDF